MQTAVLCASPLRLGRHVFGLAKKGGNLLGKFPPSLCLHGLPACRLAVEPPSANEGGLGWDVAWPPVGVVDDWWPAQPRLRRVRRVSGLAPASSRGW